MFFITAISILLWAGAVAGDGGDEFFNNFFTDLSPLIALFGERVTLQYMSQSINVADSMLLAIAPLGILTIVVAAIRVASPVWIKAIVGRSRENLAAAEMEVMSSTSTEVCELCNGENMVRTLGSGVIKEFIILKPDTVDRTGIANQTQQEDGHPDIGLVQWDGDNVESPFKIRLNDEGGWFQDLVSVFSGLRTKKVQGEENNATLLEQFGLVPRQTLRPLWIITRNKRRLDDDSVEDAPNVTLNYHRVTASRERELWFYALIGLFLQYAILVFAACITYYPFLKGQERFHKNGHTVSGYAFPLLSLGTVLVSIGLFTCAQVVQLSTNERRYRITNGWWAQLVWLQQKQVVSDQDFPPYMIYGHEMKTEYITSSRRQAPKRGQSRRSDLTPSGSTSTPTGPNSAPPESIFLPPESTYVAPKPTFTPPGSTDVPPESTFIPPESTFASSPQAIVASPSQSTLALTQFTPNQLISTLTQFVSTLIQPIWERLMEYIYLALGLEIGDNIPLASIFGTLVSVSGYVVQFFGLRALHWSVPLFQLGNSLFMTAIRTWVRRGIAGPPRRTSLEDWAGYELERLAVSLAESHTNDADTNLEESTALTWLPLTYLVKKSEMIGDEPVPKPRITDQAYDYAIDDARKLPSGLHSQSHFEFVHDSPSKPPGQTKLVPGHNNLAQRILDLRICLGWLSEWQQPASAEAIRLSSAMEAVLNHVFPNENGSKEVIWHLPVRIENDRSSRDYLSRDPVSKNSIVKLHFQYKNGAWDVDPGHVQAILALRLFSAQQQDRVAEAAAKREAEVAEKKRKAEVELPWPPKPLERARTRRSDLWLQHKDLRTQKYLRFLGQDCSRLDRDLRHWMPSSIDSLVKVCTTISETQAAEFRRDAIGESQLHLGSGDSPDTDDVYDISFFAVETFDTLTDLYTKDTFMSFVFAVAQSMDRITQDAPDRVEVDRINAEWETKNQTIDLKGKIESKALTNLVKAVVQTGFGDKTETYLHILPALSFADKLPLTVVEALDMRARWHFRHRRLDAAVTCYEEMWESLRDEPLKSRLWVALVASQFEFGAACYKLYRSLTNNFSLLDLEQCFPQRRSFLGIFRLLHKEIATTWRRLCENHMDHVMIEKLRKVCADDCHHDGMAYLRWIQQELPPPQTLHSPGLSKTERFSSSDKDKPFYRDILGQTGLHHYVTGFLSTRTRTGDHSEAPETPRRDRKGLDTGRNKENRKDFKKGTEHFREYVNIRDYRGRSALHLAAESSGQVKRSVVSVLVHEMAANVHLQDMYGLSPLHLHVSGKMADVRATRLLVNAGSDVHATDYWRNTPLHHCIGAEGSDEMVKELLEAGADINAKNRWGETPLHVAVKKGLRLFGTLMQQEDIKIDARNTWGRTPLVNAVLYGQTRIMELLVSRGADIKITDKPRGWGLWHIVAAGGSSDMAEYLSHTTAYDTLDKEATDWYGRTPLHVAAEWGNGKVMEILLRNDASVNPLDYDKRCPLHSAARKAGRDAAYAFSQDDLHEVASVTYTKWAEPFKESESMTAAERLEMDVAERLKHCIRQGKDTQAWERAVAFLHNLPRGPPEEHQLGLEDWREIYFAKGADVASFSLSI